MNETDSEISGLRKLGPTLESLIGPLPGAIGSAALTISEDEARAKLLAAPSAAETDRRLSQWLESLPGGVSVETRLVFPVKGGYRKIVDRVRIGEGVNRAEARAYVAGHFAPMTHDQAEERIVMLDIATKSQKRDDFSASLALSMYAAELRRFPADVARDACVQWADTEIFFPALAELHQLLQSLAGFRTSLLGAL